MFNLPKSLKKQSGAVLAISLIMLLLLTLIGVTAMQTTSLEEKMAGNARDRNLAFQAAESGLREGENFLTQATLPTFTNAGTGGLYTQSATPPDENADWSAATTVSHAVTGVAAAPEYVIQQIGSTGGASGSASLDAGLYTSSDMYRVTARAVGGTTAAIVVVQSNYKR